ncbi:MAG: sensory protein [Clostridium sp.]|jgi:EAL domain-containing protein (putative c-di-GMP-specific phosphodiesterase class I)|nr:sensory protein [Clostridium sp.]
MKKKVKDLNINNIIEEKNIKLVFQPVISVIKKSVIGLEAVCLGALDGDSNIISRDNLLKHASREGEAIELDRLYREKALENFLNVYKDNKEALLFIDINISIIDKYIGSKILLNVVNEYKVEPKNIVLEIVAEKIDDIEAMQKFINFYRSRGFLIALEDLGSGFANLDRISYVEPDIIKINSVITKDISYNYYKQEIFKSLINLSKKVGSLVIAEDIETEEEAMVAMELGADMLQGPVFGEAFDIDKVNLSIIEEKTHKLSIDYKRYIMEDINAKEKSHEEYNDIINTIIDNLSSVSKDEFNKVIEKVVGEYSILECVYILNNRGCQITNTATRFKNMLSQKALVFQPAKMGTDHSLKKYYYFPKSMHLNKYVTEPYVSLATGNLCVTISAYFKNVDQDYILCIDFNPDYINI